MWRVGRLVLALLVVSAGTCPSAYASPDGQSTQLYGQSPAWGGCERFLGDTTAIPTARCGTVSVPFDYAKPEGAQAQLAVIRVPATGEKIGVLVVNPGGPGSSAVDTVAGMGAGLADSEIAKHFDLVGIDPRGVGHSTPELRCRSDAEFDAYRREPMADYSPAGVAHIEQLYSQIVASCTEKMGTDFLAGVGTASAVSDMDVVRAALGENQINYLGFSYGTELGAAYAERYPDRVRAMVLDGAIDPSLDPIASRIRQMAGFQTAFNDYAADCAQSPGCPLGTDPTQFVNRYHQLVNPLVNQPAQTSDPRGLGYQDAITGTVNALYSRRYWTYLTSGLLGLQRGTDPGDLLLLADDYQGRDDVGALLESAGRFPGDPLRRCAVPAGTRGVGLRRSAVACGGAVPGLRDFTGFAPRDLCTMWPVPPTSTPQPASSPGPGKVVVVSVTHDPATPYQAGVDLARQMGASLITFDGTQHTVVFNGDTCVDTAVVNFLVDSVVPPEGLHC